MNKKEFLEKIDEAIKKGYAIAVDIKMPDLLSTEIINNPHENLEVKKLIMINYIMNNLS